MYNNPIRKGYIIYPLTSVDFQELVKLGRKVIPFYECVMYRKNFKISPLIKVMEKMFALKQEYKYEGKDLRQSLVILIINNL